MRRAGAARGATARRTQCLIHDLADGAGATAALGRTAKAAVDLARRARRRRCAGAAHRLVAQHIAGADDHYGPGKTDDRFNGPQIAIGRLAPNQANSLFKNVLIY